MAHGKQEVKLDDYMTLLGLKLQENRDTFSRNQEVFLIAFKLSLMVILLKCQNLQSKIRCLTAVRIQAAEPSLNSIF